jgi:hypothetical protein
MTQMKGTGNHNFNADAWVPRPQMTQMTQMRRCADVQMCRCAVADQSLSDWVIVDCSFTASLRDQVSNLIE